MVSLDRPFGISGAPLTTAGQKRMGTPHHAWVCVRIAPLKSMPAAKDG